MILRYRNFSKPVFFLVAIFLFLSFASEIPAANKFSKVQGWKKKQKEGKTNNNRELNSFDLSEMSRRLQKFTSGIQSRSTNARRSSGLAATLTQSDENVAAKLELIKTYGNLEATWNKKNGTPVFIDFSQKKVDRTTALRPLFAETDIQKFLQKNRKILRLISPEEELQITEIVRDNFGKSHVVLKQIYRGIPVWGGEMVLHLTSGGLPYAFNARYSPTPQAIDPNEKGLSASGAIQIVSDDLKKLTAMNSFNEQVRNILNYRGPAAEKCIWIDPETQAPHLAWHVQVRPNFRDFWQYFVDSASGKVLEKYNATNYEGPATASATDLNGVTQTIHVYETGGTYYMIDASRPIWQTTQPDLLNDPRGALWTLDVRGKDLDQQSQVFQVTSANNSWIDPVAVSAHQNMGVVFDYYFNTFGRKAIDDKGSTLISIIHVTESGQAMDNAYFNGVAMAYGDGDVAFEPLAGAMDVAAHEMTHGVIAATVNLEYKFQSGALNESFADVFGVMVDRDDWMLGEDVVKGNSFPSGALRNMADPHNGGTSINDDGWQPANMNEFLNLDISQDNGGVHINSGIPNKACYLIGNAIGKDKTEKIYYRIMNARYLNTQSQFIDLRLAAIRAAEELKGESVLTEADVNVVKNAFDTVGITGDSGTPPPGDIPPVEGEEWVAAINGEVSDSSLYLIRPVIQTNEDIVQLTQTQVYTGSSNPITVSDDGSVLLFIDTGNFIRAIDASGETVISPNGIWSSIALSADGNKLAATSVFQDSVIYIFDLQNPDASKTIHLYSPTTQEGVKSFVTQYADALDWDFAGQFLIYDAFNSIPQASGEAIEYWDVNFLDVENEIVLPLFPPQGEGISLGNPSFSQTNDNFVVFDYVDFNQGTDDILAYDLFKGEVGEVENNGASIGYPKYSVDDSRIVFEKLDNSGSPTLRQIPMAADKIQSSGPSEDYITGGQRPYWFGMGVRTAIADESTKIPATFQLDQNYPNPFNPVTFMNYTLPVAAEVTLTIYDIRGRIVKRLQTGNKPAGSYSIPWDGKNDFGKHVSSGIYLYRLQAVSGNNKTFTFTRKMTLLK